MRTRIAARGQQGSATAEVAVVLPCVALLVAVVAATATVGRAQLACHDAAWTTARLAARGEAPVVATEAGRRVGPIGAVVSLSTGDDTVTASVDAAVSLWPQGGDRWRVGVSCSSTAWRELTATA